MVTTNDKNNTISFQKSPSMHKIESLYLIRIYKDNKGYINKWYYEMKYLGYNYRIPDILCALGTSQLINWINLQEKEEN